MAETTLYNQVFYYLRDNQYPEGCTKDQKRNLRKKAQKFILDDGALFFVANENSPPKRWVHDKEEQERVLHACHSDKLAGHFGRDKTREKVTSRYYWAGIGEDCDETVRRCDVCQRSSKKFSKPSSQLHPIKVQNTVWHRIGIDLVGPPPETSRGNKYLITCTCYFSKWPEAAPLKTKSAEGVADFLYDLITRYGVAEIVMSDQGREFVNKVNQELFKLCGTDHKISSAYHPQTNGLDERMNQTLTTALVKFVNENQDDWDVHIKSVLFAYRTSKNGSTKFTPFQLMFGRAPVLPIAMEIKSKPSSEGEQVEEAAPDFEEKVRLMMEIREQVKEQAMANIDKAQERQKKNYDAKHQTLRFKEGDTVLLKNMRNDARKGGKLEKSWSGPYTVSSVLPKGLYKLQNEHGDELKTSFNSTRLKTYFHPVQSKRVKVDLTQQERDMILNQQRLDDTIINRSQNILRKQFPNVGGWQDTLLCQTSFSSIAEESVQVHFTNKNHWVCSSSIGGYVRVYDSASPKNLTSSMKVQLSECYKSLAMDKKLAVELPPAQIQQGGVDCGLFALAFACDLASGNDPSEIAYCQSGMRQHLIRCLENEHFEPFPRQDRLQKTPRRSQRVNCDFDLFCSCSMSECHDNMIECDLCLEWFHMGCVELIEEPEGEWLCKVCRPPSKRLRKM